MEHLDPEAVAALELTKDERIEFLRRDHYMDYDAGEAILRELQDAMAYPKSVRMPCRALIGDSKNGKTTLQKELVARNPTVIDDAGYPIVPVVLVEMPAEPDEGRFWSEVLKSLLVPHRSDARPEKLEPMAVESLIERRPKIILLDEFHNILYGTGREQRAFLGVIKRFSNTVPAALVACGLREIVSVLSTDPQFVTRFQRLLIPLWTPDLNFVRLLNSFERMMPLPKPSKLNSPEKALAIYDGSDKTIGNVKTIIQTAAVTAINNDDEMITFENLRSTVAELLERSLQPT
jgi:hypothetical protein